MQTYTRSQLVDFGNSLFTSYAVMDGTDTRQVSHADILNWHEANNEKGNKPLIVGQPAWFCLWSGNTASEILAVHDRGETSEAIKYDLKLFGSDGQETRIYNVDGKYVKATIPVK